MKKTLLFSFVAAVAAVSAAPTDALALNACNPATVTILNGFEPVPIGTWIFELDRLNEWVGYESCSYFVKWISPFYGLSSANLFIEELITPGYMDCEMNSTRPFATTVMLNDDLVSMGFTKFGQKVPVQNLMLAEIPSGDFSGIIYFGTNFPYSLLVHNQ